MIEISRRLMLNAVFVDTQWESILQEMQNGLYDCIIGGITITPQREQLLAWSMPYMTTTLSLVVDSRLSPGIRRLADFKRASVGVQAATTDYDIAKDMLARGEIGSIKVYAFADIGQAMIDLAGGQIDAVMKVYPVAAWLARQTPGLRIVAQVPNRPQPLGIGLRKDNLALLKAINEALQACKAMAVTAGWQQSGGCRSQLNIASASAAVDTVSRAATFHSRIDGAVVELNPLRAARWAIMLAQSFWLVVAVCQLFAVPASAQEATVVDGDTIRWRGATYDLWGIDALETEQQCGSWQGGREATEHLKRFIAGKTVVCEPKAVDRFGRTLALYVGPTKLTLAR